MVEELGGKVVSLLTIVDELPNEIKKNFSKYNYKILSDLLKSTEISRKFEL